MIRYIICKLDNKCRFAKVYNLVLHELSFIILPEVAERLLKLEYVVCIMYMKIDQFRKVRNEFREEKIHRFSFSASQFKLLPQ